MHTIKRSMLVVTLLAGWLGSQEREALGIEQKIDALLSRMTFAEKIGQMTQFSGTDARKEEQIRAGAIGSLLNVIGAAENNRLQKIAVEESRLKIPLIIGNDVIHGYRTIFPIPLAWSASWDTALIRQAARIAAKEARAVGIHWTFAPMVDIARDPRWGRIAEGAGEDPFLGAAIARSLVCGFQGSSLADPQALLACAKHYVAYGGAEGGRDYNTVDISERTLREIYLPPFEAAVRAGAGSLMSAFNEIGGIPASANPLTLRQILKGEWAFTGFVVSDWNSIGELLNHGLAANRIEAGRQSLIAGVDMDMEGLCFTPELEEFVKSGALPEKYVDDAVRRILRMKYRLGLFENPYTDPELSKNVLMQADHLAAARELARRSIVLLKNEKNILPLNLENLKTIAVIGPLADDNDAPLGTWRCQGRPEDVVTVLSGLRQRLAGKVKLLSAKGCDIQKAGQAHFQSAIEKVRQSDVVIMVLGEGAEMSGEAACRSELGLPGEQLNLLRRVAETGKPIVLVLMNGRPLVLSAVEPLAPAIVETWHLGVQHGNAVADVLCGDYNPSGKLTVSFPRSVGQIPVYYNHKNTGRPANPGSKYNSKYLDVDNSPLYPFGYGNSYTRFEYSGLKIANTRLQTSEDLRVSVSVKNVGKQAGTEVVQLYVQDLVASVTRPVRELKGFQRVTLSAGQQETVTLRVPVTQLGCYDINLQYRVEPGEFRVYVGGDSRAELSATFNVVAAQ